MCNMQYPIMSFSDSIFLLETSEQRHLFPLALCSLESAALHNPTQRVFLLRTTKRPTIWSQLLNTLSTNYPNLSLRRINADHQVADTPLATFWQSHQIETSHWIISHTR